MDALIGITGMAVFAVCLLGMLISLVRRFSKKRWGIGLVVGFAMFVTGVSMSSSTTDTSYNSSQNNTNENSTTKVNAAIQESEKVEEIEKLSSQKQSDLAKNIDQKADSTPQTYKVVKVIDGDTIKISYNGKEESLRLIGIDTPESVHPDQSKNTEEGKIASKFTQASLEGKDVVIEFDVEHRDKYGRLLGYVWLNDVMFNKTLLSEGYAKTATYPPNVKYVDDFKLLQQQARALNKGFWVGSSQNQSNNAPSKTVNESTTKLVGSTKSNKYHYTSCRWAEKINAGNEIWFNNSTDAKQQGYQACKVCSPR